MANVGTGEDALLAHQAHGFIDELDSVVDRDDACLSCVRRAGFAGRVHGDVFAHASGLANRGVQLGFGVLIRSRELAIDERVTAGLIHFGEIGAQLILLAHHVHDLQRVVGVVGVGENVLRGIEAVGILVAAENVDRVSADAQPRPGNEAFVDGVTHGGIGRTRAFGPHVALGGEAGHQVVACGQRRENGALWDRLLDCLHILCAGM